VFQLNNPDHTRRILNSLPIACTKSFYRYPSFQEERFGDVQIRGCADVQMSEYINLYMNY